MTLLYADGSSSLKSGFCGWAVAGVVGDRDVAFCGFLKGTNQVAEVKAVMYAMRMIPVGGSGTIVTDSEYAIKSMTEWWAKWEVTGFRNASNNLISNYDLIQAAHALYADRKIAFKHVRGHTGVPGNEKVDALAKTARFIGEGKIPDSFMVSALEGAVLVRA